VWVLYRSVPISPERYEQIQRIPEGRSTQRAAADRLGLSSRRMKSLVCRYRQQGRHGIVSSKRWQTRQSSVPSTTA
jgi:Helix-turn-helix domain